MQPLKFAKHEKHQFWASIGLLGISVCVWQVQILQAAPPATTGPTTSLDVSPELLQNLSSVIRDSHQDKFARAAAFEQLAAIDSQPAAKCLADALDHVADGEIAYGTDSEVCMCPIAQPSAIPELLPLLKRQLARDQDYNASLVARMLGQSKDRSVTPTIVGALDKVLNNLSRYRPAAAPFIFALGDLGDPAAVEILGRAFHLGSGDIFTVRNLANPAGIALRLIGTDKAYAVLASDLVTTSTRHRIGLLELQHGDRNRSIPILITAMSKPYRPVAARKGTNMRVAIDPVTDPSVVKEEQDKLHGDISAALHQMTGEPEDNDVSAWRIWWDAHKPANTAAIPESKDAMIKSDDQSNPTEPSPADHDLKLAGMYADSGQTDLARHKYEDIVRHYSGTPAAVTAQHELSLLDSASTKPVGQ